MRSHPLSSLLTHMVLNVFIVTHHSLQGWRWRFHSSSYRYRGNVASRHPFVRLSFVGIDRGCVCIPINGANDDRRHEGVRIRRSVSILSCPKSPEYLMLLVPSRSLVRWMARGSPYMLVRIGPQVHPGCLLLALKESQAMCGVPAFGSSDNKSVNKRVKTLTLEL